MSQARFEVLEQLDQLEEIVLEGARVPFSGGRLVNESDAVDILDAQKKPAASFLRQIMRNNRGPCMAQMQHAIRAWSESGDDHC